MQRLRVLALGLFAALTIGAIGVASASAATPEWFKGGKAIGAAEKIKFTGKAGEGRLEAEGGAAITCKEDSSSGEIEGPKKETNVKVTYKGCKKGTKKCKTTGAGAEEIKTETIVGENVYLDSAAKGHNVAGVKFTPKSGSVFVKISCEGELTNEVTEGVYGEAKPLNGGEKETGELVFAQEGGKQQWRQLEEAGAETFLKAFGFVKSGLGKGSKLTEKLIETVTFTGTKIELHKS